MRAQSWRNALICLSVLVLAGCGGGGGGPMTGQPLPADGEIDLIRISEAVWAREAARGIESLTPAERVFLCVWNLEAEVNNGGFEQFFINSAGDNALETPGALREIGATRTAAMAEEANSVFGPSGPPADRDARQQALERLGASAIGTLDALDTRFFDSTENIDELLTDFVDRNREHFSAP